MSTVCYISVINTVVEKSFRTILKCFAKFKILYLGIIITNKQINYINQKEINEKGFFYVYLSEIKKKIEMFSSERCPLEGMEKWLYAVLSWK